MIRVLLDCDGVLSDFVGGYLRALNAMHGTNHRAEDVKTHDIGITLGLTRQMTDGLHWTIRHQPGFVKSLAPLPGAVSGVAALRRSADVHVVTAPWFDAATWDSERRQWLWDHFRIPGERVTSTHAKYICAGDVLVDDKVEHLKSWHDEHPRGLAVLWEQPYNSETDWHVRTQSWPVLVDMVIDHERNIEGGRV
jgi:5'(3')-deoxyribonucleotidase